jgi:hypothetical protein
VTVTGEGLASNDSFDISVDGYDKADSQSAAKTRLLNSRFSPDQTGSANWSADVDLTPIAGGAAITYILVVARKDDEAKDCNEVSPDKVESSDIKKPPTCLFGRVPPQAASTTAGE